MSKYGNSSYWLSDWDDDDIVVSTMSDVEKKSHDLYKLAASKRAISNFVNIVTNDQIPVQFNTRGDSYTNGKAVVIGADVVEPKDFDIAVGLALHEGSHIKLSDFQLLNDIYNLVPQHIKDGAIKKGVHNPISIIKDIWNVIEDRRIDKFVFDSAPGYRDYYRAMYDKYFNDSLIDKGLNSDEYRNEDVESYMFRIINIHNKNTDVNALKGLKEIYNVIGLNTISRLKNSLDTFNVALEVFKVILSNLPTANIEENKEGGEGDSPEAGETQNGEGQGGSSDGTREMSDEEFEDFSNGMNGSAPMGGDDDSQSNGGDSMEVQNTPDNMKGGKESSSSEASDKVKLSDRQKELLKKKIEKQKDFMDGDVRKKTISKKENENLNSIEESGSDVVTVGNNINQGWGRVSKGTQCVVVKKLTKSLLESEMFPMTHNAWGFKETEKVRRYYEKEVAEGIKIGTILGKKLQVRGEDRNTVFNRQKHGKIDKRMISSLGFGNENVFQYIETDSYKKANLHISIDASGSMSGSKWNKTMTNVVALCKAVDMIQNLSIQVSFRTTTGNLPYIVMAYDSRTDKFSKVKQMFPALNAGGTTPEGLCFEAIMNNFLGATNDMDSYFVNISDGEPYFGTSTFYYTGNTAFEHTRKMVKQIEGMGIKTLSYFVDELSWSSSNEPSEGFKKMYGKGARKIDVTNIAQITKTMNQLFLEK
jgi:hypothetical protein